MPRSFLCRTVCRACWFQILAALVTETILNRISGPAFGANNAQPVSALATEDSPFPILELTTRTIHLAPVLPCVLFLGGYPRRQGEICELVNRNSVKYSPWNSIKCGLLRAALGSFSHEFCELVHRLCLSPGVTLAGQVDSRGKDGLLQKEGTE